MKNKFSKGCTKEFLKQLEKRVSVEQLKVDVRLTVIKTLHATWFNEFFNRMLAPESQETLFNGLLRAGISDAIN